MMMMRKNKVALLPCMLSYREAVERALTHARDCTRSSRVLIVCFAPAQHGRPFLRELRVRAPEFGLWLAAVDDDDGGGVTLRNRRGALMRATLCHWDSMPGALAAAPDLVFSISRHDYAAHPRDVAERGSAVFHVALPVI
jgi:hypothetical protein